MQMTVYLNFTFFLFSEEDVSPNDNLTFSAFKQQQQQQKQKMAGQSEQQKPIPSEEERVDETKQSVKGMTSNDILMLAIQELHNER